jgi:nitrate reductase gamma subunit
VGIKKIVFRSLGVILGLAFIIAGALVLINPIFDTITEKLSHLSQIFFGLLFVIYGITGKSSVNAYLKKRNKK